MLIHFARTLYHRTGLYAAVGWARGWVLGEVAVASEHGMATCVRLSDYRVVRLYDYRAQRIHP